MIFIALIGIAVFSIAEYISTIRHVETPESVEKKYNYSENKEQLKDIALPETKPDLVLSKNRLHTGRKTDQTPISRSQEESLRTDRREDNRISGEKSSGSPPLDQKKAELGDEQQGETFTAIEWFNKGRALDDESEDEILCYKKAIELDPEFAPAYYFLGAIFCRQANYELADQEFTKFLKYSSDADKQVYDIYVYYSPSDVARLSAEKINGQAPAEVAEKETASEGEKEKLEATEKEITEQSSEESLEATEKEAIEQNGEETSETTEKETTEPTSEEVEQETSEVVMTIVRFFPVDGHILVPVELNGILEARVLVDTGAGITVLSKELAEKLELEEESGHSITLKTMATEIQAQLATLSSIKVGNLTQNNLRVAVIELPFGEERKFDGVLGMDFMNNYKIHIDNENNRILLSPLIH